MRKPLALFALSLTLISASAVRAAEGWLTSLEDARAKAKETKKVILADFTGSDWCPYCIKLQKEVFSTDEFQKWAEKNVILLEIDFPKQKEQDAALKEANDKLSIEYKVEGFPTVLFLDAEGKELGRSGYEPGGPAAWIKSVERFVSGEKPAELVWLDNYEEAVKVAKKEKKLILADFTGSDWCSWCIKLRKEVFETDEFKKWATKNVVLLELDFPRQKELEPEIKKQNEELQAKYKIQGFPTILFLDTKGKTKGQMGYEKGGPEVWIEKASKIAGKKK